MYNASTLVLKFSISNFCCLLQSAASILGAASSHLMPQNSLILILKLRGGRRRVQRIVLGHLEVPVPHASIGQPEGSRSLGLRVAKTTRCLLKSSPSLSVTSAWLLEWL